MNNGYRVRLERKRQRAHIRAKADREDAIAYAEPHLRDYEAAYLEANGVAVEMRYERGWCYGRYTSSRVDMLKLRLQQVIAETASLQARVHERVITNGGTDV